MENKTAEELEAAKALSAIRENMAARYGFNNWSEYRSFWRASKASPLKIESAYNELAITYASLQCAEMKTQLAEKQREVDALRAVIKDDKRIQENESKECAEMKKENERLRDALIYARNMLVGYSTRHPDERQIMLSSSNDDVFLLIENALSHDTINKP